MNDVKPIKKSGGNSIVKELRKNIQLFIMLVPGLIFVVIFNYIPLAGITLAFKNIDYKKSFFEMDWVGFKNFEFFLRTPDALVITRNTILYNLVFISLGLVVAVSAAIALNEIKNKFLSRFYQSVMFLPYFLSWVVVSFLVFVFLNPDYGFINKSILAQLGSPSVSWYNEPKYWPYILVFINIWKNAGYSSVIYFAAITGIDREMYEAADLDGANRWQQITHITLPCLLPMMIIMTILAVGKIFNSDFGLFYHTTLNSGTLYQVTNVLDTYVYRALKYTG
ncbi:MAG: sugar ABC transporter permease, partial [Clostridiales bacterium 43-6]